MTYAEYAALISRISAVMRRKGIRRGDAVIVEARQMCEYLAVQCALQLIGAVFVPVEQKCKDEKIVRIAQACEAKCIVSDRDTLEELRTIFYTDIEHEANEEQVCPPESFPAAEDVSEVLFSSGTTGREKGIILTHGNNVALAENVIHGVQMENDNVELIPSPMNHSHGLRRYYANMYNGGAVILLDSIINGRKFFEDIQKYHVTAIDMVPTALSILLKLSGEMLGKYKDQIRYIQLGSAAIHEDDKQRLKTMLPHTRLYNFYGSTESGCICIYDFNTPKEKPNCIGKPTCNTEIVIVDSTGAPMVSDKTNTGILASRGPMNMMGYINDSQANEEILIKGGYLLSADEAYIDEDGDIVLMGRHIDIINIGGKKVTPEEIENAARKIEGVVDCGCVGIPDTMKGQVPKLVVVIGAGHEFNPILIKKQLGEYLEVYKIPEIVTSVEQLPRNYNGKLLRKNLIEI